MSELKPCPFCGGDCLEVVSCVETMDCDNFCECMNPMCFTVVCNFKRGGCGATGGYRKGKEKAIEAWNRRVYDERI